MNNLMNKDNILFLLVGLIILGAGISNVFPKYQKIFKSFSRIRQDKTQVEEYQKLKNTKMMSNKPVKKVSKLPVKVFQSEFKDMSIESASTTLVSDVIDMIKNTGNNVTTISYEVDQIDKAEKKNIAKDIHVLSLNMSLSGTYLSLQNLLKKLYVWSYLYGIHSMKIYPKQDNKRNLDIDLVLWLYIKQ